MDWPHRMTFCTEFHIKMNRLLQNNTFEICTLSKKTFKNILILHSYGYDTITGDGLQKSWPWSSEGSHLQWHGAAVNKCHHLGPVTLKPIALRFAVELSLPVLMIYLFCGWDSNIQPTTCGANALTDCVTATAT